MIKALSKNIEIYYASLLERPEILAGKLYYLQNYKMCLKELADYMLNAVITMTDFSALFRLVAYTYHLWKREHPELSEEQKTLRAFIDVLRKDMVDRMEWELQVRESNR